MEQEVKKTAVEIYREELIRLISNKSEFQTEIEIFKKAKEIEKQQIIEAFENGYELDYFFGNRYYNETYENPKD